MFGSCGILNCLKFGNRLVIHRACSKKDSDSEEVSEPSLQMDVNMCFRQPIILPLSIKIHMLSTSRTEQIIDGFFFSSDFVRLLGSPESLPCPVLSLPLTPPLSISLLHGVFPPRFLLYSTSLSWYWWS